MVNETFTPVYCRYCDDSFGYFEGDEDVYRIIRNMTPYFREMVDQYVEGEHEIIYVDAGV